MSSTGFLFALVAPIDPLTQGTNDMIRAGHTMVFMAILIAAAGIGFRIYLANKKRSNRPYHQPQMPWTSPPSTYPPPQAQTHYGYVEPGVFCPRCGVRSSANYCIGCGYDLQNIMKQLATNAHG